MVCGFLFGLVSDCSEMWPCPDMPAFIFYVPSYFRIARLSALVLNVGFDIKTSYSEWIDKRLKTYVDPGLRAYMRVCTHT